MTDQLPTYGGQAVIEGVMMRGSRVSAIAVRAPDDEIIIKTETLGRIYQSRLAKIPFLRGLVVLWDSLALGMRALTYSANIQAGEDEKIEGAALAISVISALLIGVGVFFLLPTGAIYLFQQWLGIPASLIGLLEGLFRLSLLVGYIWWIARIPEIKRVYGYHGAEHMTINAFEDGAALTPEVVARYPREHPRCGTAFLLTVVLFSIIIFSLLGPMPLLPRLLSRVLLIPVLASLAYEYIRLTARFSDRRWAQIIITPNLALQRLTTRFPDLDMIEVAICAFTAMREREDQPVAALEEAA